MPHPRSLAGVEQRASASALQMHSRIGKCQGRGEMHGPGWGRGEEGWSGVECAGLGRGGVEWDGVKRGRGDMGCGRVVFGVGFVVIRPTKVLGGPGRRDGGPLANNSALLVTSTLQDPPPPPS